ncbi:chaperone NapD [Aliikangiella coralliicola]|uniref:Chaperone NapD n=1 Tax=Aliikangiella coralliicola TaxID=2592383 RepID=A0A545U961_9GAMM|nr:chaperone NapD [Aliikangiella coralliicola]TQV85953.1 sorbose reductase [Aliikangiella coralliicola]
MKSKTTQEHHVTSLVCQTIPGSTKNTISLVEKIKGAEVHGENTNGKIVVTLEGDSQAYLSESIEALRGIEGILTLAPVYHEYITENHSQ